VTGITLIEGEIGEQGRQAVVGEEHSTFVSDRTAIPKMWAFSDTGLFQGVPRKEEVSVGSAVYVPGEKLFGGMAIYAIVREVDSLATEGTIRDAFRSCLGLAEILGIESIAVPAIGTVGREISMQKSAEILLNEVRKTDLERGSLSNISFVLKGEPSYRVFEMVNDSVTIADQITRLKGEGRV